MKIFRAIVVTWVAALAVLPVSASAQASVEQRPTSFAFTAGYFLPVGSWKNHRVVSGLNQFDGSYAFQFDFERRIGKQVGLALVGGYVNLSVRNWEEYAAAQGDQISASAYFITFGAGIRFHVLDSEWDDLKIGFNGFYFYSRGEETFLAFTYDYNFFHNDGFAVTGGLEYNRFLSQSFSVVLRVDGLVSFSGVEYDNSIKKFLFGFPFMGGVRFHF